MITNDYIAISAITLSSILGIIATLNNFKESKGQLTPTGIFVLLAILSTLGATFAFSFTNDIEEKKDNNKTLQSLNELMAISKNTIQRIQKGIEKSQEEIRNQHNDVSKALTLTTESATLIKNNASEQQNTAQMINELLEDLVLIQATLSVNVAEQETTAQTLQSALRKKEESTNH